MLHGSSVDTQNRKSQNIREHESENSVAAFGYVVEKNQ